MYTSSDYEEGYSESLARAVAALSEATKDERTIIGLLQKHWDLSLEEARERLAQERLDSYPKREVASYLVHYRDWEWEEAKDYVSSNGFGRVLKTIDRPWTMDGGKIYEQIKKKLSTAE